MVILNILGLMVSIFFNGGLMNDNLDEINILECGFDNSSYLSGDLSDSDNDSDNSEQEEQEEQELADNTEIILSDIYDELVDIHADILVLNDSINNVALCVGEFANVFVEFFVVFVIMVLLKAVFDNLLHFFK